MLQKTFCLFISVLMICGHSRSDASGFVLIEQSVSGMGTAYASGAAGVEDASIIYFNPAGISKLCGTQMVFGGHIVLPSSHYNDDGSILYTGIPNTPVAPNPGPGPGDPLTGDNPGNFGKPGAISNFYYSHQVDDCLTVGLCMTTPAGLVTDYGHEWPGRYHAIRSSLLTFEINPVASYNINDCLSIGGGLRAMYLHANLSNAVDYGTIAWLTTATLGAGAGAAQTGLNALGFLPTTQDGRVILKGNSWGFGANAGILWEPCCGTRFGFGYRSQVKHKIKGAEKFKKLPAFIDDPDSAPVEALRPFFAGIKAAAGTDTRVKANAIIPDIFIFSAFRQLNPCWAILGDISWTRWKLAKGLTFRFNNPNQPDATVSLKWQNTMRYSVGVIYTPNCCWTLRSGFALDESPNKNREFLAIRIPDNDRYWATVGFGYQWNCNIHFDFAYAYLWSPDTHTDKTDFEEAEDFTRGGTKGKYTGKASIVSAQVVWSF